MLLDIGCQILCIGYCTLDIAYSKPRLVQNDHNPLHIRYTPFRVEDKTPSWCLGAVSLYSTHI